MIKCLLHKQGDLSFIPNTQVKSYVVVWASNPSAKEAETGRSLRLSSQLA